VYAFYYIIISHASAAAQILSHVCAHIGVTQYSKQQTSCMPCVHLKQILYTFASKAPNSRPRHFGYKTSNRMSKCALIITKQHTRQPACWPFNFVLRQSEYNVSQIRVNVEAPNIMAECFIWHVTCD